MQSDSWKTYVATVRALADFEDEEDNAFRLDVAAIDTALAAIKRLIELEYEKE